MKGIYLFAFLIFFLSVKEIKCQIQGKESEADPFKVHLAGEVFYPDFSVVGSQYFKDEWSQGNIVLVTGEIAQNVQIRYNGFLDEVIIMKTPSFQQVKLDKYLIHEFMLFSPYKSEPERFKRIQVNLPPLRNKVEIFAQVLYDGEISLYSFRRISATGKVSKKTETGNFEFTQVEPDFLYFLIIPGREEIFFNNLRRRNLYKAFPERKPEIRRIFNKAGVYFSNEEKYKMVVQFLNENHNN